MRKTRIEKVISSKIKKWIDSIKDESLRKEVKNNIIVTGGCIVSLLNNEVPNDYDIYFRTKDIAKKVAQYYCNVFNENHKGKKNKIGFTAHAWVLDGEDVEKYKNGQIKLTDFAYGYHEKALTSIMVSNTPPDRIKVMINSDGVAADKEVDEEKEFIDKYTCDSSIDPEIIDKAMDNSLVDYLNVVQDADEIPSETMEETTEIKESFRPVFLSTNAITLSDKIQLVFRFYGEPDKIHDTFDYIHCMCYWASWENKLYYTTEALDSIINKELKYVGSKYPICSVLRMRKFISRGWTINAGQILKMAFQISELRLDDIAVLEDQLVGVDSLYFMSAIESLKAMQAEKMKNGESFTYDSTYLSSIIDKVFK